MWLKFVCVFVIANAAFAKKDELLDKLYGLEGRNKMSICVATASGWRQCDGALYKREWVIARAQCLATAPMTNLTVERPSEGGSCQRLAAGQWGSYSTRPVRYMVMHPWFDLALIITRTPYMDVDLHANATNIRKQLHSHGVYKWMKYYFKIFALTRNFHYQQFRLANSQKTFHHPFWYFSVTILLPSVLYILFFIYVTHSRDDEEVPYKHLHYSKKVTHV